MAKSSNSGMSHGSEKNEVVNDDDSDTTLSESLASTEVCSLTLDSNGEPASRRNLADLAGKRGRRACTSTRSVVFLVLGCTALAGCIAVAGWAGANHFIKKQSAPETAIEAHSAFKAPELGAPVAAAALVKKNDDREAGDGKDSEEISRKNVEEEEKKEAKDPINDIDIDKEIEEMDAEIAKEEESNEGVIGDSSFDDQEMTSGSVYPAPSSVLPTEVKQAEDDQAGITPYDDSQDITFAPEELVMTTPFGEGAHGTFEPVERQSPQEPHFISGSSDSGVAEPIEEEVENHISSPSPGDDDDDVDDDSDDDEDSDDDDEDYDEEDYDEVGRLLATQSTGVSDPLLQGASGEGSTVGPDDNEEFSGNSSNDDDDDESEAAVNSYLTSESPSQEVSDVGPTVGPDDNDDEINEEAQPQFTSEPPSHGVFGKGPMVGLEDAEELAGENSDNGDEEEIEPEVTTEAPPVAEIKDMESVLANLTEVAESKSMETKEEIASAVEEMDKKIESVARIQGEVAKVDGLKAEVEQLIDDEKAGQEKVAETEQHMQTDINILVDASKKLIEGSHIEEKEENLAEAKEAANEKEAEIEAEQASVEEKQAQLAEKEIDLKKEEKMVKEIAEAVAQKENETEKMAEAEEKREEQEDEREKNEQEREEVVEQIEAKVEGDDVQVVDNIGETKTKTYDVHESSQRASDGSKSTSANASTNATSSNSSRLKSLRYRRHRMQDYVRQYDPEQNYGADLIDGDIRISKKFVKKLIKRKLRDLADLGDYVDVVEEDMAHLGIGEKCTNLTVSKEDVQSFSWPNGLVRYAFATNYSAEERHTILDAMNNLADLVNNGSDGKKCIAYTPYDPVKDKGMEYVWFYPGEGCESPVGAPHDDSNRHVSLASACMERGVVQHELIHILGFWHEQSRTDRDKYVEIKWENIEDGICDNFKMYADPIDDAMGLPYDYHSIMSYKSKAFSKNGKDTIVPKNDLPASVLGQRVKPTDIDLMKVRLRYNCTAKKDPKEYKRLLQVPIDAEPVRS